MSRNAVIALGAMVVLGGVFFATQEKEIRVGVESLDFSKFEKTSVSQIVITGAQTVSMKKEDAGWLIQTPAGQGQGATWVKADGTKVDKIFTEITKVRSSFMVSNRKDALEGYELNKEKGTQLTFSSAAGELLSLVVGRSNNKGSTYMKEAKDDRVFAVRSALSGMVKKGINDWRGRGVWDLALKDIAKVTFKPAQGSPYSITVNEEGKDTNYQLAEGAVTPVGFRFGNNEAKRLVSGLMNLRANDFFDGDPKAAETGFGTEHASLIVERREGKSINLHIGAENDKKQRYVEVEGNPQVYLIQSSNLKNLLGDVNAVRAMNVIDFDENKVVKIEIAEDKNKTVLSKENNGWGINLPKTLPAGFQFDPNSVERQLRSIKNIKAEAFVGAPASQHGLKKPSLTITLTDENGSTTRLAYGAETEEGSKKVYLQSPIDNGVYKARAFQKTRYQKGVELFKKFEAPKGDFSQAQGFNNLPPDVRKSLEEQMRKNQMLRK